MQIIHPSAKQLFCKPKEAITQTRSGFLLAAESAEKPQMADVISVGSKVEQYKANDTIIYKPYATTEIKVDGKDCFLVAEEDVLGSVTETE